MSRRASVILLEKVDGSLTAKTGFDVSSLLQEAKAIARNPPKDIIRIHVLSTRGRTEYTKGVNKEQAVIRDGADQLIIDGNEVIRIESAPKEKGKK